ncbi:MAG: phage tail protein [Dehalococcoidia bacterium]
MAEPFLGEIRIFGFNFAPRGWAQCDGQLLPIAQNQSLFAVLGTTYGGDGRTSFALPDLRGRSPMHEGNSHTLGEKSGAETVSLTANEVPSHTHNLQASSANAGTFVPTGMVLAANNAADYYDETPNVNMNSAAVSNGGGNQGHETMQPYLALNFCIAISGLFPSRN